MRDTHRTYRSGPRRPGAPSPSSDGFEPDREPRSGLRRRGDFPRPAFEDDAGPHAGHGRGGHRGRGPGRRAGRGDVRAAVLLLLAEQPMHGYQLIHEIAERSGGRWQPSPGAVYPALAMLEDEGLVTITADAGRKLARLTDTGAEHVAAAGETLGTPWDDAARRSAQPGRVLRDAVESLGGAAHQVARTGDEAQLAAALAVLEAARRDLYLILAGEQPAP